MNIIHFLNENNASIINAVLTFVLITSKTNQRHSNIADTKIPLRSLDFARHPSKFGILNIEIYMLDYK